MHPALSIILFSTLSGAGLGLGAWAGSIQLLAADPVAMSSVTAASTSLAILLSSAGLASSVFHLKRPSRAWRAFSQWRSSWLSREAIVAPIALAFMAVQAGSAFFAYPPLVPVGTILVALCCTTVLCTAMIYAQIRAVPAWNTPLTPLTYLGFAASTGLTLVAPFVLGPESVQSIHVVTSVGLLLLIAWVPQVAWWMRADRVGTGSSTIESATGLRSFGGVRLLEPPHTGSNYLLDEMGFAIARRHSKKLRAIAVMTGLVLPVALVAVMSLIPSILLISGAAALHLAGVGIARWLFFAEARHVVSLYY